MATQTPNYNFQLPEDGGDDAQWGGFLNSNWSSVDTILKSMADQITQLQADVQAASQKAEVPVGGLYYSTTDTDPAVTLGYGTWEAYAQGRAVVGVGNNGASDWTPGQVRGVESHVLTVAEMPNHGHGHTFSINAAGGHDHSVPGRIWLGNGGADVGQSFTPIVAFGAFKDGNRTTSVGNHGHGLSGSIQANGSSQAHDNVQPSIAVYIWRRTA